MTDNKDAIWPESNYTRQYKSVQIRMTRLSGVYTTIHIRHTCLLYRCAAYMYYSVNIYCTCTSYLCAVSNMLKTTCMCSMQATANMYIMHVQLAYTPYVYHSVNTALDICPPLTDNCPPLIITNNNNKALIS